MTYLIDSDYVADYLVAKPHATELLLALAKEGIGINLITVGEIYEGIYYGRDPHKAEAIFRQFLRMAQTPSTHPNHHAAFCTDQGGVKTQRPDHR